MVWLNGVPGSNPSGSGAKVVPPQQRQSPAYRSTRVTTGATFGRSTLSNRAVSVRSASASAAWQCAQRDGRAVTVSSGVSASRRPPPWRPRLPWRGPVRAGWSSRFGFLPRDGGKLELSAVFGGRSSLASNSTTRTVSACTWARSVWISAAFSACESKDRSGRRSIPSLNQELRGHVKRFVDPSQRAQTDTGDEQILLADAHAAFLRIVEDIARLRQCEGWPDSCWV